MSSRFRRRVVARHGFATAARGFDPGETARRKMLRELSGVTG
ncbi:hypothetical protein C357_10622 [Citreicella sp. 357]|nr:hypothetical protein C357_10622 [Citreicella sp. 357]